MSVMVCARCCTYTDTDHHEMFDTVEGDLCLSCASTCRECDAEIDPEEAHRKCEDCLASYIYDRMLDEKRDAFF